MAAVDQPVPAQPLLRALGRFLPEGSLLAFARTAESPLIFALAFGAYFALGYWVVIDKHVVVGDGLSRLAHAYFVFWDHPAKLAAIGFEWPPLDTLLYLPLAVVKPVATSLTALPASSALFGAGLLVVLNRTLAMLELRVWMRYVWLLAFAANPMIAFYASNGMAEVPYLFVLTLAFYLFLRWRVTNRDHYLILVGFALALAFLARFELLAWTPLVLAGVALVLVVRRQASGDELEGDLLATAAPVVFGFALWCMFNWLIIGDPLFWLKVQTRANLTLGVAAGKGAPHGFANVVATIVDLNWRIFLLAPIVVPVLVVVGALKRNVTAIVIAAATALNAAMTITLVLQTGAPDLLRLRYNMRAMPLALICAGWLFYIVRDRLARIAVWVGTLVALAVSIPVTAAIMKEGALTYYEDGFIRAVTTGRDQEGSDAGTRAGSGIGIRPEKQMAAYIKGNLPHALDRILTDDGQSFGVMLVTGHPDWFADRIDHGDAVFKRELEHPYRRVGHGAAARIVRVFDYFLVSRTVGTSQFDKVLQRYPSAPAGGVPWLRPVHTAGFYVLLRVAAPATVPDATRRALAGLPPLHRRATPRGPAARRAA